MEKSNKDLMLSLRKRFLELDKFKRKELDAMALKFGHDTRPFLNTMWYGANNRKDNYSNCTKAEVIFIIIFEEFKRDDVK